jgi:hypothetical protein
MQSASPKEAESEWTPYWRDYKESGSFIKIPNQSLDIRISTMQLLRSTEQGKGTETRTSL